MKRNTAEKVVKKKRYENIKKAVQQALVCNMVGREAEGLISA